MPKKPSEYEKNDEILRKMGLVPEGMTIRQRHEALFGPVGGEPLTELLKRPDGASRRAKEAPDGTNCEPFCGQMASETHDCANEAESGAKTAPEPARTASDGVSVAETSQKSTKPRRTARGRAERPLDLAVTPFQTSLF